jgi:RNA polymerase sigma factor (sigma-70 family)
MEELSMTELVGRAATDDDAFRVLQHRFKAVVWANTARYGFNQQTREDVAQLVWLKLFQHLTRLREPERLAGWLAVVTRNESARVAKGRAMFDNSKPMDDVNIAANVDEPDRELIRSDTVRTVAAALVKLDDDCRELLRLLILDSPETPLSYKEVAELLDMPIGSIGPTRQRCLEKLASDKDLQQMFPALRKSARTQRSQR